LVRFAPPVQGHDTHTQRARNFALQLPLPHQIFCLRQLRRDFHPRVPRFTLAMAACPAAATSIGFAAQGSIAVFWTSPTNRRRARCTESSWGLPAPCEDAAICALMSTHLPFPDSYRWE